MQTTERKDDEERPVVVGRRGMGAGSVGESELKIGKTQPLWILVVGARRF